MDAPTKGDLFTDVGAGVVGVGSTGKITTMCVFPRSLVVDKNTAVLINS